MKIGDRARSMIARGVNPHAGADLSGSRVSIFHHHTGIPVTIVVASSIALFLAGALVPDGVKSAVGLRISLNSVDLRNATLLVDSHIDANHPLPDDLPVRLAISTSEMRAVRELLTADTGQDAALSGTIDSHAGLPAVSPGRVKVLKDFLSFLNEQPRAQWSEIMAEIQFQRSITGRARAILASLANANNVDVQQLGSTLSRLMALPFEKREALYRAGFPTVPAGPDRQALYAGLETLSDAQATFMYSFMHDGLQDALSKTSELFKSRQGRKARALLGLLADGRNVIVDDGAAVSPSCDVAHTRSCERKP